MSAINHDSANPNVDLAYSKPLRKAKRGESPKLKPSTALNGGHQGIVLSSKNVNSSSQNQQPLGIGSSTFYKQLASQN